MNQPLHRFKAEFFKALAHPLRIMILELLRPGEASVSEIQSSLGIESSHTSQQLAVLRSKNIIQGRKVGNNVLYSVIDPVVFDLLDISRRIFNNQLIDFQAMVAQDMAYREDEEP